MMFKVLAFFALVAAAFASPNPKPDPQLLAYSAGSPYVPAVGYAGYSAYSPGLAYASPYAAPAAVPYAYSGYYVR